MFYIRTADRLTRTSVWLERLEGGIDHLRDVVVHDSLGIAGDLERQIQALVDSYACEWRGVVEDPVKRAQFRHFANDAAGDATVTRVEERGQHRPGDRPVVRLPVVQHRAPPRRERFVRVARACDIPADGGIAVKCGDAQLAIFQLHGAWYATQNACPHSRAMVLARGIVGDEQGTPKVACPLHKRTFDLTSGRCLSGDAPEIATYPVRVLDGEVWVELPERAGAQDRELAS
jgi:nitrite reductase (NADH) large subunit